MTTAVSPAAQFALLAALSVTDGLATDLLVRTGLVTEANPIMAPFVAAGLAATLAAKAVSLAAGAAGLHILHRRGHARLARSTLRALVWAYSCVAVLHIGILAGVLGTGGTHTQGAMRWLL